MAGVSIHMSAREQVAFSDIHRQLHRIADFEQISKIEQQSGDTTLWLLVYEKYFFRNNSYATVTVLLTEQGGEQHADIISAGGGESLGNFSWGANRKMAADCVKALEELGFSVDEKRSDPLPKGFRERFIN